MARAMLVQRHREIIFPSVNVAEHREDGTKEGKEKKRQTVYIEGAASDAVGIDQGTVCKPSGDIITRADNEQGNHG
jgi:hypothetical protein